LGTDRLGRLPLTKICADCNDNKDEETSMRALIGWALVLLMPSALFAADGPTGVIYGTGSVYLDGSQLANSAPVILGDIIETKEVGVAHLDMSGSTAVIQPNAVVRLQAAGLSLDRGSISMATGKSLTVSARDFQITPVSSAWTQFDVTRSGGLIQISARKNSVTIGCGVGAPTVIKQGQQITRADAQDCGLSRKSSSGAPTAVHGPILASPWAEGAGIGAAAGVLFWTLHHNDDPVSPYRP
jgi:hypothetical protein